MSTAAKDETTSYFITRPWPIRPEENNLSHILFIFTYYKPFSFIGLTTSVTYKSMPRISRLSGKLEPIDQTLDKHLQSVVSKVQGLLRKQHVTEKAYKTNDTFNLNYIKHLDYIYIGTFSCKSPGSWDINTNAHHYTKWMVYC